MSINKLLDISRRSLFIYQKALEVTSHNIANANNKNYSRQNVIFGTVQPDRLDAFGVGDGVKIEDIVRLKNQFTENQLRLNLQNLSFDEKKAALLSTLEPILSEPSELGLSNQINAFFNAWEELAVNPLSSQLRGNVVQTAENLANKLKSVYEGFTAIRAGIKKDAIENVNLLNKYVSEIRTINDEIYKASLNNISPNDLLDRRDELISELSKLANINVSIDSDNMANISIGGVFAVDRYYARQFKVTDDHGSLSVQSEDGNSTLSLNKGELGAIVQLSAKTIPGYLDMLDNIGQSLYESVNAIHSQGYTNHSSPLTGINFFQSYQDGILVINEDIRNDQNYIATSSTGTRGDNEIAKQIAALKDSAIINGSTVSDYYSSLVTEIGNEIKDSQHNFDAYSIVNDQLEQQKSSYSGVSLDEEMANVLKFQKSYEASAKLIKVADEIFQTLLDSVR